MCYRDLDQICYPLLLPVAILIVIYNIFCCQGMQGKDGKVVSKTANVIIVKYVYINSLIYFNAYI